MPPAPFGPGKVNGAQAARFAFAGLKTASKLHPAVRAGSFAYDVWNFYNNSAHQTTQTAGRDWTGWELYRDCGTDGEGINQNAAWTCGNTLRYNLKDDWLADENKLFRSATFAYARCYRDLSWPAGDYARMRQANIYRMRVASSEPAPPLPPMKLGRLALPIVPMTPEPWPLTLMPALQPINQPRATPSPLPFQLIPQVRPNPNVPRQVQRQSGNSIANPPEPWTPGDPIVFPGRPPRLDEIPMVMPPMVIGARPLPLRARQLEDYHQLSRNGVSASKPLKPRKVKERKIRTSRALGVALAVFSAATEGFELIDIFYKNLPDEYKPRYVRPDGTVTNTAAKHPKAVDKLDALAKHWDKVDLPNAIRDVGNNIAEDAFYGTIGQYYAKANRQALGPLGFDRGPGLNYGKSHLRYIENQYRKSLED